jgi:hypothetical protein
MLWTVTCCRICRLWVNVMSLVGFVHASLGDEASERARMGQVCGWRLRLHVAGGATKTPVVTD